jgi:glycosyltransferase involved in cell wall biosynthesis
VPGTGEGGSAAARYATAHAWAEFWSQHWFLDVAGEDRFGALGVDGGWATHIDAFERLLRFALRSIGASDAAVTRSLRSTIKARGLDRVVRALGLRMLDQPSGRPGPAPVALVVETPTTSMLEPAARVARALGAGGRIATSDPRAFRDLRRRGLRPHALTVGLREQRRLLRSGRRAADAAWERLVEDGPAMPLDGIDRGPDARAALRSLARASMPWLLPEALAVERFLDAVGAHSVAIASDQHRIGRLVTGVAAGRSVRAVVLQHGLPQSRVGYLPVVADTVAAWSDHSRDWFVANGSDPQRVRVLGNPRLDPAPSERIASLDRLGGNLRILVPLSPTALEVNVDLLNAVLDAGQQLGTCAIAVKLHPGDGDWRFVPGLVRRHAMAGRTRIFRAEPLDPLLRWASATVVHRSSVAFESLASGTPVIVWQHPAAPSATTDLPGIDVPVVDRTEGLVTALRGGGAVDRGALTRLVGPQDGRAAERIAGYLLNR